MLEWPSQSLDKDTLERLQKELHSGVRRIGNNVSHCMCNIFRNIQCIKKLLLQQNVVLQSMNSMWMNTNGRHTFLIYHCKTFRKLQINLINFKKHQQLYSEMCTCNYDKIQNDDE